MSILLLVFVVCAATSAVASAVPNATIVLQTGRVVAGNNGSFLYNGTADCAINTQYADTYNYGNGGAFSAWGSSSFLVSDLWSSSNYSFRYLVRFRQLAQVLPPGATILSAELALNFINWGASVDVKGCFQTKPWQETAVGPRFKGTGWVYNMYNATSSKSQNWTSPGAWADCDPRVTLSIPKVQGGTPSTTRAIQLDPKLVQQLWVANNGNSNFGLLFKAANGQASVTGSLSPSANVRPILSITYSTDPDAAALQPQWTYPATSTSAGRILWVSDAIGDDLTGNGYPTFPFKSPFRALQEAFSGDSINLKSGVYAGGFAISRPGITLQSAPGELAVISLPVDSPVAMSNVIQIRPGADNGTLRNLEIVGGFYYGIMLFTDWQFGSLSQAPFQTIGINNWLFEGLRVHHTGSSGIKMTMASRNITIRNSEIYSTGYRYKNYGHGIEGVQAHGVTILDCYIHDVAGAGIHLVGGSRNGLIARNYIANASFGMNIGFATEYEYMDWFRNPWLFENINTVIANNIVAFTLNAGINLWAAAGTQVYHNTLWQVQQFAQAAILLNSYQHVDAPGSPTIGCANISIGNNILVKSPTARAGPVFQIRAAGLNYSGYLNMTSNVYYDAKGISGPVFAWGKGAMLEDERNTSASFISNLPGWVQFCTGTLGLPGCDAGSREADPLLGPGYLPAACSAAANAATALHPPPPGDGAVAYSLTDDFHGRTRSSRDIGAVAVSATGPTKPWLPVPLVWAGTPPYSGPGRTPDHDFSWPYDFWTARNCTDIRVDPDIGDDSQAFNYNSNYAKPFKTIQQALVSINQCDRIVLAGGKVFSGRFGIYRPNVTITTDPASTARATVKCSSTGGSPCIMMGDGLYDGAAHVTLKNFDINMTGPGPCIQINEGQGSGGSPYWDFYVAARNLSSSNSPYTVLQDMRIKGCGSYGVKLSTFVTNVKLQRLEISNTGSTAIEVRNGVNLIIQDNYIHDVGGSGILLGGGARNCLVQNNVITSFADRGILLGSDNTEAQYMGTSYAALNDPEWHDNINSTVRSNTVSNGAGAGIAFYSARDAVVYGNSFLNNSLKMHAGVILNVSPKQIGLTQQVGAPNRNISFYKNTVTIAAASPLPMVEFRIMQATMPGTGPAFFTPNATSCPTARRSLRHTISLTTSITTHTSLGPHPRRSLLQAAPGTQGRNPDGSCPTFPDTNPWHLDVTQLPVHPKSATIKLHISGTGTNLRPDFGGGTTINGKAVLYGIPFVTVDSSTGQPALQPVTIDPVNGYPAESDPGSYPIPANAPVEGAYAGCPPTICPGDRHVLVLDNATCMLYETYVSVQPSVTGTGRWGAAEAVKFNLSSNALRPLGWTSADAAGLPVYAGLFKFQEAVTKGVINHALRFTGPNSRAAYALPATHFAAAGDRSPDAPWMGLRVRLNASFDCSKLRPVARVFCVALQKYGGIFADNGSPWFFSGEATSAWGPYLTDLQDIRSIPSTFMDVLDTGCLCLDPDCMTSECGGQQVDPSALPVYTAVVADSQLDFHDNLYYPLSGAAGRYVDRRTGTGRGYDGGFSGWELYINETNSFEANPLTFTWPVAPAVGPAPAASGSPAAGSPVSASSPVPASSPAVSPAGSSPGSDQSPTGASPASSPSSDAVVTSASPVSVPMQVVLSVSTATCASVAADPAPFAAAFANDTAAAWNAANGGASGPVHASDVHVLGIAAHCGGAQRRLAAPAARHLASGGSSVVVDSSVTLPGGVSAQQASAEATSFQAAGAGGSLYNSGQLAAGFDVSGASVTVQGDDGSSSSGDGAQGWKLGVGVGVGVGAGVALLAAVAAAFAVAKKRQSRRVVDAGAAEDGKNVGSA